MKDNYFGLEVHTHLTANLSDKAEAIFFPCYLLFSGTKGAPGKCVSDRKTVKPSILSHLPVVLDVYGNSLCHSHLPQ